MEKKIGIDSKEEIFKNLSALERLSEDWPENYRLGVAARVAAVESINKVAFTRIIQFLKGIPNMREPLKEMVKDEVIFAVLRHHGILKPTVHERIEESLNRIRPMLKGHGGDIDFLGFEDGVVKVSFTGACDGCPASTVTFYEGVKKTLTEDIPEIKDIRQVKGGQGGRNHSSAIRSPFDKDREWRAIADLSQFPSEGVLFCQAEEYNLILYRSLDKVTCYENSCAHMGLSIEGGEIDQGIITCPHHGFRYALTSGECLTAPEIQLRPREVRIEGSRVELMLNG